MRFHDACFAALSGTRAESIVHQLLRYASRRLTVIRVALFRLTVEVVLSLDVLIYGCSIHPYRYIFLYHKHLS